MRATICRVLFLYILACWWFLEVPATTRPLDQQASSGTCAALNITAEAQARAQAEAARTGEEYFQQAYKNYFGAPGMPAFNFPEAHRLAQLAADFGSANGQALLGIGLVDGLGVAEDEVRGVALLREAAAKGSSLGTAGLGRCHVYGWGVHKNKAEGLRFLREAAGRGDAYGRLWLGDCYYAGRGVARNYEEAARWLRLAAEQGLAEAQYSLGMLNEHGEGVPEDLQEGCKAADPCA